MNSNHHSKEHSKVLTPIAEMTDFELPANFPKELKRVVKNWS